jgi:GT2 family glycosyltransferase
MKFPKCELSIIIVSFCSEKYIKNCISSVLNATYEIRSELFLVDNCSQDNSVQIVSARFPKTVILLNKKNLGFSRANNQALKQSSGEYILLLNPDTILTQDSLGILVSYMKNHVDIGMIGPKLILDNNSPDWACFRNFPTPLDIIFHFYGLDRIFPKSERFSHYSRSYLDKDVPQAVECISGAFMLIRRRALQQVGLLDERFFLYFEDLDLSIRFNKKGWKVYYFPEVEVLHYKRGSTSQAPIQAINHYYNSLLLGFDKYYTGKTRPIVELLYEIIVVMRKHQALAKYTLLRTYP